MDSSIVHALGGLGFFLLGIRWLTGGLRELAGERLREHLAKASSTPVRGAFTGALATAVIQSSSATTVAAVGFAGAGLIAFEQALGIILGANVGTTITGWIVALVGFKLKLGSISYLLLLLGALLHLVAGKRMIRTMGDVLAGFAMIFIGIDLLKEGMSSVASLLHIRQGLGESWSGRLLAVGFGVILTLLTQSSSATIAATLTAVSAGVIELPAALALAIGADVGTTATAALATVGGSVASRQTGWAHVIYNCLTGLMAFFLLPVYLWAAGRLVPAYLSSDPESVTVAFHTGFNLLGMVIALPFTRQLAALVRHLVPDREEDLTRELDALLLVSPQAALDAVAIVVRRLSAEAIALLREAISEDGLPTTEPLHRLLAAIQRCREYLARVISGGLDEKGVGVARVLALIHALDHVERLAERCLDARRAEAARTAEVFSGDIDLLRESLGTFLSVLSGTEAIEAGDLVAGVGSLAGDLESDYRDRRKAIVEDSVTGRLDPARVDGLLDALRWIRRCAWHYGRIARYVAREREQGDAAKP